MSIRSAAIQALTRLTNVSESSDPRVSKVLIAGPVGVGKTTAVRTLSTVPVLETDVVPSDETRHIKSATTVAMDFGVLRLDERHVVHLYGTPGQRRFEFMWEILSSGSAGLVVLVDDGAHASPEAVLDEYLAPYAQLLDARAVAIGVTRLVRGGQAGLAAWQRELARRGLLLPVFEADPRKRRDVERLVRASLIARQFDAPSFLPPDPSGRAVEEP